MDLYSRFLNNYIPYDRLFVMTRGAFGDRIDRGEINLYIDLHSYLNRLWDNVNYEYKNDNVLAASIINACAHYRNYFWSRHMCKTNIYLVWGWNTNPYAQYPGYNKHHLDAIQAGCTLTPWKDQMLAYTKDQLKFLCQYLPQIYFVDGGQNEVAVTIYSLASNGLVKTHLPDVIISKDVYAYQLVAGLPFTFVYHPKSKFMDSHPMNISWVVTKANLFKAYRYAMGYKTEGELILNPTNLRVVLGLSGMVKRHIKGLMSFNQACKQVARVLPEAAERQIDIYQLETALEMNNLPVVSPSDGLSIIDIHNMLDLQWNANLLADSPTFISMQEGLVDLYNPQGVMEIANKEFNEYPLELGEL